jgi:tripartite ATP-independent transporter DctP family solute receptor
LAASLLMGSLAGLGVQAADDPIELKLSLTPSESSIWMVAANSFKEEIEEKTEGRYTVSIYPSEQLAGGDLVKGVEMLLTGSTDIAMNSVMNMSSFDSRLTVTSMPWLFSEGYDSVDEYVFNGEGADAIKEIVSELGAVPLALGDNGFRQITNNKNAIAAPEDLDGLKIRTPANSMYIELFREFGADPTSMNFSEVYTALQNGTIDGQENPIDTINSARIQEVSEYLTIWNYSYDLFVLSLSENVWNSLSEEDQEIFQTAADNACQKEIEQYRENEATLLEEFKGTGLEITELTDEQIQAFQDAAAPVYETYKDEIGEDLFAKFGYTFE